MISRCRAQSPSMDIDLRSSGLMFISGSTARVSSCLINAGARASESIDAAAIQTQPPAMLSRNRSHQQLIVLALIWVGFAAGSIANWSENRPRFRPAPMPAPGLPIKLNERISLPCLALALPSKGRRALSGRDCRTFYSARRSHVAVVNPLSLVGGD